MRHQAGAGVEDSEGDQEGDQEGESDQVRITPPRINPRGGIFFAIFLGFFARFFSLSNFPALSKKHSKKLKKTARPRNVHAHVFPFKEMRAPRTYKKMFGELPKHLIQLHL
jgi:hypothetical protein